MLWGKVFPGHRGLAVREELLAHAEQVAVVERRGAGQCECLPAAEHFVAGEFEARLRGFDGDFQFLGDFVDGPFLEVVHDENGAKFGAEAADEVADDGTRFGCEQCGFGVNGFGRRIRRGRRGQGLAAIAGQAAIVGSSLNRNDEKPGARSAGGIEILDALKRNGKDFLGNVVGIAYRDAVTFDRAPDEFAVRRIKANENAALFFGGE